MVQLFPRAADDVKLSLILECLPRLSVKRILSSMSDSEKEVQSSASKSSIRRFIITEKAPTRAFSLLKVATSVL